MIFRPDIQILRGAACVYVVAFHLGLPYTQNGYLGVDIFFVISGFLMAVLYNSAISTSSFFYKRASRILPAYYTVMLVTLIASFVFNTPNETNQVTTQAFFGSTFTSNIGFWLQNSYFSKAEFNPLLHFWSLAVEVQFYITVPFITWVFLKRQLFLPVLIAASIASCFLITELSPKTSFFLTPFRIWEFLSGFACAVYITKKGNPKDTIGGVGVLGVLVILAIPLFPINPQAADYVFGHPGGFSLAVTIATCCILSFGLPLSLEKNIIARTLSVIGKYSYSLYLVHFPIIVIYNSRPFSGTITELQSPIDLAILLGMILGATIVLYHLVEKRRVHKKIVHLSAFYTTAIVVLCLTLPALQSLPMTNEQNYIFEAFSDRSTYRCGKIHRITNPTSLTCELTGLKSKSNDGILLVGNSHADSIKTTFAQVAKNNGKKLFFVVQNNPLNNKHITPQVILSNALETKVSNIVLHYSPASVPEEEIRELVRITEKYNIRISFIDPVPVWPLHIPKTMYTHNQENTKEHLLQTEFDYQNHNSKLFNTLNTIKQEHFTRYEVTSYFCQNNCSYKSLTGIPYYFDEGHLTLTGSRVIENLFKQIISE